ncbi:MAG TPA: glycosyl hydrolase family 28 protein, partial [Chthoniobacterales bacterium]|nr:glycosyl hydrolase family 28 protein [Chthoniobacterales bacterium]
GNVVFPSGRYLAASIHLLSNVRLALDKDAVITGAKNGYDSPEPNAFEKYQDFGHSHFHNALMWGEDIENVAVVGGRINGGGIIEGDDPQGRDVGDKVIAIKSGRNLLFGDIVHESGGHFVYLLNNCEQITLANVVIKKSRDGVNLVSCRNAQIHDCRFTGCGDDSLALKSDYALGRKIGSANIYVWNCYLESAANALQIGAESVGNFGNVNFWKIQIGRAWKAGIGMRSADGGIIDGVTYRDISMKNVDTPISMTVGRRLLSGEVDRRVGAIKNVRFSNVSAEDPRPRVEGMARPSLIAGLPESAIENVTLENVRIIGKGGGAKDATESPSLPTKASRREDALSAAGFFLQKVRNIQMRNVNLTYEATEARPSLVARDVSGLVVEEFRPQRFGESPRIKLEKVDHVQITGCPGMADQKIDGVTSIEE